jgi:hypothetical protein
MEHSSPLPFSHGLHHQEQLQRVVTPSNQNSIPHYQGHYNGYDTYHRSEGDVSQHDPRQQVILWSGHIDVDSAARLESSADLGADADPRTTAYVSLP